MSSQFNILSRVKKTLFLILLCNVLPGNILARDLTVRFNHITNNEGLSQNTVDHIFKDSRGFVWFATRNGLNRFDGYSFKVYRKEAGRNSLSSNFVHNICEDSEGNIWVGTENGLNIINIETNQILTLLHHSNDSNSISGNNIIQVKCDGDGIIWAGTHQNGLNRIEKTKDEEYSIKRYQHIRNVEGSLSANTVNAICIDDENNVWVGTNWGLNKLNKETHLFLHYHHQPGSDYSISNNSVLSIYEDSHGFLWIGTWHGLNRIDSETGEIKRYYSSEKNKSALSNSTIRSVNEDADGNLLIGTTNGVNNYNRNTDSFYHFPVDANSDYGLRNEFVNCIETDGVGNVWIGTHMGGVSHYNIHQKKFGHIPQNPPFKSSVNHNVINSIFSESDNLWIGTAGSGLYNFNKKSGSFRHYSRTSGLKGDFVSAIQRDSKGILWVGTWGGGLNKIIQLNDEVIIESISSENGWSTPLNSDVTCIYSDENLLLVGGEGGIELVDNDKKKITPIANDPKWVNNISEVRCLMKDQQGFIWLGTRRGLFQFHESKLIDGLKDIDIKKFQSNVEFAGSLPSNFIETICEDINGNIWIGTFGHGLSLLIKNDSEEEKFINFNEKDGLSNNVIYRILPDESGNIWMSTDNGLSKYNPETNKFSNFYESDGLQNNQFYWGAACKGEDGRLYFGGINGVNFFKTTSIETNSVCPKVMITDFKIFNKSVNAGSAESDLGIIEKDISCVDEVKLSYKHDVFSLEFSALNYLQPEKIEYAYQLDGVDKDWVYVSSQKRFANYTHLKGGKYTFLVRASNGDGEWSIEPTRLDIIITPPFWDTMVFKIFIVVLIISLVSVYFRYRTRILVIEKERLESMVQDRTMKVEKQKKQLADQNQEITEQRDELIILNEKVEEANQLKLRFFTNVSHEFRTPITLISAPVKNLLANTNNSPETNETLHVVYRNAQRLMHLVNQLLDFRKIETGKLQLKVSKGKLSSFINDIAGSFIQLSNESKVELAICAESTEDEQYFDKQILEDVLFNLLSNAFKHTPEQGRIKLDLSFKKETDDNDLSSTLWAVIRVTDTGSGISADHINKIFDRFYQVDNSENTRYRGTGIGLSLTKDLVDAHYGNIEVTSEVGKGSQFIVSIPVSRNGFDDSEVSDKQKEWNQNVIEEKITASKLNAISDGHADIKIEDESNIGSSILVVEDNHELRKLLVCSFSNQYHVLEAEDGKQAYEIAKLKSPSLIISDVMMPEMNGIELCSQIKSNLLTSHIPVVLLTARAMVEHWIEGLETGADDYVPKPFDIDLLKAKVKNILNSREKLRKHFSSNLQEDTSALTTNKIDQEFLEKALKIVEDNYADTEFGVKNFVHKMYMSHSLLHKKLKTLTGQSSGDFITTLRLKKAAALLQNSSKNINEIAFEVGFNDPKYFSQKFKRYYGVLPSKYNNSIS